MAESPFPPHRQPAPARERVQVFFSGLVQGVGFRFTCTRAAAGFPITGWVRNLPDGRVELIAEGERQFLERFLAVIQEKRRTYIEGAESHWFAATGEFDDFRIGD